MALPSFTSPPLAEVALAVQFERLALRVIDLHVIHEAFQDEFPTVEEFAPQSAMGLEAGTSLELKLLSEESEVEPPLLRFKSEDDQRVVQFQPDRLVVNWRRRPQQQPYPRYETTVRPMLVEAWKRLERALLTLNVGPLVPNVCEVTYVNPIETDQLWGSFGDLDQVVAPWSGTNSDDFLPEPSGIRVAIRYEMTPTPGWMLIEGSTARRNADGQLALLLNLVARGPAASPDLDGALAFLDTARDWIVRGFVSITTPQMHAHWGMESR